MKKGSIRVFISVCAACAAVLATKTDYLSVSAEMANIVIDRTNLKAGEKLSVIDPVGYTLRFYVDDVEAEGTELTLTEDMYEKWITVKAFKTGEMLGEDRVYFSRLPVVYIDTDDGGPVESRVDYKSASMFIQNNAETTAGYDGAVSIRGRGNSTWTWAKKPYKLKLDKKAGLFGMGENKHWVLLANYLDESLLRNTTAAQISEELGLNAMDTVWVDLVFNGEYAGNYQLCEQVKTGSTRVDIYDWEDAAGDAAKAIYAENSDRISDKGALEDYLVENMDWITSGEVAFEDNTYTVSDYYEVEEDITGGYLFELSEEYDELSKFMTENELKVMLKSPEYLYTNPEMFDYVQKVWNDFEKAFRAEDGYTEIDGEDVHYSELADIDSLISYWLVMEVMGNDDAFYKSRYVSKDIGGLLTFGPVWDFDWGCGSFIVGGSAPGWKVSKINHPQQFYREFLDDPWFVCMAAERYWALRPFIEELTRAGGVLETEISYLKESGQADEALWDRSVEWGDDIRGFETDTELFAKYLRDRTAWLDRQFATDRGLLRSLHTRFSASPYIIRDDMLALVLPENVPADDAEHVPADGVIGPEDSLEVKARVSDRETVLLNIYVNGLFYGSADVSRGKAAFTVSGADLNAGAPGKNVVSVIGKDAAGKTTYRNFTTVRVR